MVLELPEMGIDAWFRTGAQQDELGALVQAAEDSVMDEMHPLLRVQTAHVGHEGLVVVAQPLSLAQDARAGEPPCRVSPPWSRIRAWAPACASRFGLSATSEPLQHFALLPNFERADRSACGALRRKWRPDGRKRCRSGSMTQLAALTLTKAQLDRIPADERLF